VISDVRQRRPARGRPILTKRRSSFAILSVVVPACILVVGFVLMMRAPFRESDWFAFARLGPFVISIVLASVICTLASLASVLRREPRAAMTLVGAVPSALVVACTLWFVAIGLAGDHERSKHAELIGRLVAEPALREAVVSRPLDERTTRALLSPQVADLLTPEQVERIWDQRKDIDTGNHHSALIWPAYTPEHVLREYYDRLVARGDVTGDGTVSGLANHTTLLHHRNLPRDVIDELLAQGDRDVLALLERNPKLTTEPAYLKRWEHVPPQPE